MVSGLLARYFRGGCSLWRLSEFRILTYQNEVESYTERVGCGKVPRNLSSNHHRFRFIFLFPSALRNFFPLCERHFNANCFTHVSRQKHINYHSFFIMILTRFLISLVINFYRLNHEQISNSYKNSNLVTVRFFQYLWIVKYQTIILFRMVQPTSSQTQDLVFAVFED